MDGVLADQQKTRFDTYEQAGALLLPGSFRGGPSLSYTFGNTRTLSQPRSAIDCGLAFQLTNILRDVLEDAQRGRIYLPRQHYEQHGLSEDDLLTPRP